MGSAQIAGKISWKEQIKRNWEGENGSVKFSKNTTWKIKIKIKTCNSHSRWKWREPVNCSKVSTYLKETIEKRWLNPYWYGYDKLKTTINWEDSSNSSSAGLKKNLAIKIEIEI